MSFLEGAALPVVFITAYYALHHVARITDGESNLIHSGAGGTGRAAIQIAKLFNANVYVTVGSDDEKRLLMDLYDISEDHIFYSRNASFTLGIRRLTRERGGVAIVLISQRGDALSAHGSVWRRSVGSSKLVKRVSWQIASYRCFHSPRTFPYMPSTLMKPTSIVQG